MHLFLLAAGFSLLSATAPVTAAENRSACMQQLGLTEQLVQLGSFRIRLDGCIRQRVRLTDSQDRAWRLQQRAVTTSDRLERNAELNIRRAIGVPESDIELQRRRETVDAARLKVIQGQSDYVRPSRRAIIRGEVPTSRSLGALSGDLFYQRQQEALKLCSPIENNFHRTNCIRAKMRQLGQQ
jgi:hypothetical protein